LPASTPQRAPGPQPHSANPPPPTPLLQDGNLGLVKQVVARAVQRTISRLTATYLTLSLTEVAAAAGLGGGAAEAEEALLRWGPLGLGPAGAGGLGLGLVGWGCGWRAGAGAGAHNPHNRHHRTHHTTRHTPPPPPPRRMIDAGDIRAAISGRDGMVHFREGEGEGEGAASAGPLAEQLDGALRRCMALAQRVQAVDLAVSGAALGGAAAPAAAAAAVAPARGLLDARPALSMLGAVAAAATATPTPAPDTPAPDTRRRCPRTAPT
jgi:hypothetical protein